MKFKNYLLTCGLLLFFCSSAFAYDWTIPNFHTVVDPVDGMYCYIENVASQRQMTGRQTLYGHATTTGLANQGSNGQLCLLIKKGDEYYITRANDGRHNFRSSDDAMHVDGAGAEHDLFVFVKMPNGKYQIKSSPNDATYGAKSNSECWGWMGAESAQPNHIYPNINPTDYDAANTEWQFVEGLREIIGVKAGDAESVYRSIDLAAVYNIFSNSDATAEQLLWAATEGLAEAISKARQAQINYNAATAESPVDATEAINNRSFEYGDLNGWTVMKSNDTGVYPNTNGIYSCDNTDGDYLFNTWSQGNKLSQKIYALPNGLYKVSALLSSDDNCTNVYLFANDQHKAVTLQPGADGHKNTHFTPGSIDVIINNGLLEFGAVGSADESAAENEGIKAGVDWTDNGGWWWYKADHFQLHYYGPMNNATYTLFIDANYPAYSEDYFLTKSIKDKWEGFRTNYKDAANDAARNTALANLDGMKPEITANEQAWTDYLAKVELARTTINECDAEAAEVIALSNYVNTDAANIISNKVKTTAELQDECAAVDAMITAAKSALVNGADVTSYMANPKFDNGATGWNGNPTVNASCGEMYNAGKFEVYQEVEDLPVGLYEVSMQGFYRKFRDDDIDKTAWYNVFESTEDARTYKNGQPEPLAFVFMNDSKTPMNCVYDYAQSYNYDSDEQRGTCEFYGSGYSVDPYNKYAYPNDMGSAAKAFAAGAYKVSAFGLVAKSGDKLRIGVKGDLGIAEFERCSWAIFDNFKLTFRQKDPEVINSLLPEVVASLDLTQVMGADVKQEIQETINTAQNATDNNAKFEALVAVYAASAKIDASVEKFKTLKDKIDEFREILNNSQATQQIKDNANTVLTTIKNQYESGNMTDAECVEASNTIDAWIVRINIALNNSGYATFSSKHDMNITGVEAYKASVEGETITLTQLEGYIPAGTGVLLYSENPTAEVSLSLAGNDDTAADVTGNDLNATTKADGSLAAVETNSWALGSDNKFRKYTGGTYKANRAYLVHTPSNSASSKALSIVNRVAGTTSLENVDSEESANEGKLFENGNIVIIKNGKKYNLAGQEIK